MDTGYQPAYLKLGVEELTRRAEILHKRGASCTWCPRRCGADRTRLGTGDCGVSNMVLVASANLHFGEESHFVGYGGSGTVFFSGCNLGCLFCQNHDISHGCRGMKLDAKELSQVFIMLQDQGAENLNLVTPSHYPAQIMEALALAVPNGLKLPVVWNSGGYDSVETLGLFDGVVDLYMPDFKFASDETAERLTAVSDYASVARQAITEMVRQVGPGLKIENRVARRGISVRHLVMPGLYDDSRACLDFLHSLSPQITVNVMSQYRPAYLARTIPEIMRSVDQAQFAGVVDHGRQIGMENVLCQA